MSFTTYSRLRFHGIGHLGDQCLMVDHQVTGESAEGGDAVIRGWCHSVRERMGSELTKESALVPVLVEYLKISETLFRSQVCGMLFGS